MRKKNPKSVRLLPLREVTFWMRVFLLSCLSKNWIWRGLDVGGYFFGCSRGYLTGIPEGYELDD